MHSFRKDNRGYQRLERGVNGKLLMVQSFSLYDGKVLKMDHGDGCTTWERLLLLSCPLKPVNPKGNQPWIFIGKTNAEAEAPILWPPDAKSWLIRKDPDAGKDWGQKEKGMAEDEMAEWHRQLNEHEFEWTPGVGEGQGSLACCGPWGRKESDTTERQQHSNKVRKEKGRKDWLEK